MQHLLAAPLTLRIFDASSSPGLQGRPRLVTTTHSWQLPNASLLRQAEEATKECSPHPHPHPHAHPPTPTPTGSSTAHTTTTTHAYTHAYTRPAKQKAHRAVARLGQELRDVGEAGHVGHVLARQQLLQVLGHAGGLHQGQVRNTSVCGSGDKSWLCERQVLQVLGHDEGCACGNGQGSYF